jgi:putative ABC transport system substrate-binding protein
MVAIWDDGRRQVAVIATPGSTPAAVAAKAATSSVPIVFAVGADPVELGLVASLNRLGGNATGITSMNADIAAKRFELIRELVPQATRYYGLVNPASPLAQPMVKALEAGAATVGIRLEILRASNDSEIDAVMGTLHSIANVMVSGTDALFFVRRSRICRAGDAPELAHNL